MCAFTVKHKTHKIKGSFTSLMQVLNQGNTVTKCIELGLVTFRKTADALLLRLTKTLLLTHK